MNTVDERNLEACVLTLSRWKGPLSPELRKQIQAAGQQLPQDESAASELPKLLKKHHDDLANAYEHSRLELRQKYNTRERAKGGAVQTANNKTDLILEFAASFFTADDYPSAAKQLVTHPRWKSQVNAASDDVQTFFKTITETVTQLDNISVELLKILDKDVFTVESLAYRLDMPKEKIEPLLEALWQQHYIYPISHTVTGNIWGSLNIFTQRANPLNTESYVALTIKGYFYLHPYFQASRKQTTSVTRQAN